MAVELAEATAFSVTVASVTLAVVVANTLELAATPVKVVRWSDTVAVIAVTTPVAVAFTSPISLTNELVIALRTLFELAYS